MKKVVFMGMGEPAHNLDNVLEASELLGVEANIAHKDLGQLRARAGRTIAIAPG